MKQKSSPALNPRHRDLQNNNNKEKRFKWFPLAETVSQPQYIYTIIAARTL